MSGFYEYVVMHHFWLVMYGIIGYFLILWTIAKSRAQGHFKASKWWRHNYDEIIVTIFIGLSFIIFDDEVEEILKDFGYIIDFKTYHYLMAGPVTDLLIKTVYLFKKINPKN